MQRLHIICDLDSIVIDLLGPWLAAYNEKWEDTLTVGGLVHYDIAKLVKPECGQKVFQVFARDNFYINLPPLPGALEGLKELHKMGHEITICTGGSEGTAKPKFQWVKKHLPFLDRYDVFIGMKKHKLHGDVFIDDAPQNLRAYKAQWPDATILTIAYPYNEDCKELVHLHADGHDNTTAAWKAIVEAVQHL